MSTQQSELESFWGWFKANSQRLKCVRSTDDLEYREIETRLGRVGEVEFEIGGDPKSDELELILTAHGDCRKFPLIDAIVAEAPEISGWRIYALKPPLLENIKVTFEGASLVTQDVRAKLDLERFGRDRPLVKLSALNSAGINDHELIKRAALILLESFLGERAFSSLRVEFVWPSDIVDSDYIQLDELARRLNVYRLQ